MAIYHMKMQGLMHSVPMQIGIHIAKASAELDESTLDAVAQTLLDAWEETLRNLIADDFTWEQIQSRRVDQAGQPSITRTVTGLPMAGTAVSAAMPKSVAPLMRFFSNTEEPNRGWNFIPGATTGSWGGTGWNTTIRDAVDTFAETLITEIPTIADGFEVVIAHIDRTNPQLSDSNPAQAGNCPAIEGVVRERRFA